MLTFAGRSRNCQNLVQQSNWAKQAIDSALHAVLNENLFSFLLCYKQIACYVLFMFEYSFKLILFDHMYSVQWQMLQRKSRFTSPPHVYQKWTNPVLSVYDKIWWTFKSSWLWPNGLNNLIKISAIEIEHKLSSNKIKLPSKCAWRMPSNEV